MVPYVEEYLLPWLFSFALVYGTIHISGIFKDEKKIEIIISLAISLFAIFNQQTLEFVQTVMPFGVIGAFGVFGLLFLKTVADKLKGDGKTDYTLLMVLLLFTAVGLTSATTMNMIPNLGLDRSSIMFILSLGAVVAMIWVAYNLGFGGSGGSSAPAQAPEHQ